MLQYTLPLVRDSGRLPSSLTSLLFLGSGLYLVKIYRVHGKCVSNNKIHKKTEKKETASYFEVLLEYGSKTVSLN